MTPIGEIAWPGPVPLGKGAASLAGRARELRLLLNQCKTYDVIVLTAWSGVGKTSFVDAAVVPALQRGGARFVPTPVAWQTALDTAQIRGPQDLDLTEAAERLYRVVIGVDPHATDPIDLVFAKQAQGRPAVIVLDQYEELLRYHGALAAELLDLVGRTARDLGIPHIVVARAEYREYLHPLDVPGGSVWSMTLSELRSAALPSVVTGPATAAGVEVSADAVTLLVEWWDDAREAIGRQQLQGVVTEAIPSVGLLHFQSLLWSFKAWAVKAKYTGTVIDRALVKAYETARAADATTADANRGAAATWIFQDALVQYVRIQADRLAESEEGRRLTWRNGPQLLLARIAPAMTAAGFKQPQTVNSLITHALGDELTPRRAASFAEHLQEGEEHQRHGGQGAIDRATPGELNRLAFEQFNDSSPEQRDGIQPAGVAAKCGWSGDEVVHEMLNCLQAALDVMSHRTINVLRPYGRTGEPIYELVHDGMGSALKAWAREFLERPLAVIGVIAHQPGRSIVDASINPGMLDVTDVEKREIWGTVEPLATPKRPDGISISRLGWPGSAIIGTTFTAVCFDRCNFRGASFINCEFDQVVFRTCDLTATLFLNCRLHGVTFDGAGSEAGERPLDLLTIKRPSPDSHTKFTNLPVTTGLFLQGLHGGSWGFVRSKVRHLVIEASAATTIAFRDTEAFAVSAPAHVSLPEHGKSTVRRAELAQ